MILLFRKERFKLLFFLLSYSYSISLFAFPRFEEVRSSYLPSDILILDRNGEKLQSIRTLHNYRSLSWIPSETLAKHTIDAILLSEDKNFREHKGVDSLAFIGSVWEKFRGGNLRGGSTITMQLVSLLDGDLKPEKGRRSFFQKMKQIQRAMDLEEAWSKEEILTAYLNLIYFKGELKGIHSASLGLFQKDPEYLSPNESYILSVLIRAPEANLEKIIERACILKKKTEGQTFQDCDSLELTAKKSFFKGMEFSANPSFAPQFGAYSIQKGISNGEKTSLSKSLQDRIAKILVSHISPLRSQNVTDGAVLVLHNRTGQVLGYLGNQGSASEVSYLDLIQTKRQAGSTLKPFVYAQSFQEKKLTPGSILNDAPTDIPVFRGIYRPLNYDKSYQGKVTVKQSLGSSLNIPAVRTLSYLDMGKFINTLSKLGFKELAYPEFYGPSLALGTADVSLWELTNAYRTFANAGIYSEPKVRFEELGEVSKDRRTSSDEILPEENIIFRPEVAFLITSILSDREARAPSFGWENHLSTSFFTAVKTGTSQDMRDNWCIGYSGEYTVGVWVGNAKGLPMKDVSGIAGAAPVWRDVMEFLHSETPSLYPKPPENVFYNTNKQTYYEKGLEDESMETFPVSKIKIPPKIISPADQTVFADDPDIPKGRQKILFKLNRYEKNSNWSLNKKILGPATEPFFWNLEKGNFQLELLDQSGKVLDQVSFEVR
ncbi:penicillin-binding protein 1C [Leptospira kobayashii]|uniref:peptidoglycan glycosyltransferase n=1 Tax=Leptospira kobayashii TaxID=1917830 RepID=A0ABN6KLC2_9LEPT|nr:penicillin-binding protein 1C [Leptospira kobayashii]